MQLQPLTATNLHRYNSIIYTIKELIDSKEHDELCLEEIRDSLLIVYYGIDEIAEDLKNTFKEKLNWRKNFEVKKWILN